VTRRKVGNGTRLTARAGCAAGLPVPILLFARAGHPRPPRAQRMPAAALDVAAHCRAGDSLRRVHRGHQRRTRGSRLPPGQTTVDNTARQHVNDLHQPAGTAGAGATHLGRAHHRDGAGPGPSTSPAELFAFRRQAWMSRLAVRGHGVAGCRDGARTRILDRRVATAHPYVRVGSQPARSSIASASTSALCRCGEEMSPIRSSIRCSRPYRVWRRSRRAAEVRTFDDECAR
jgi:hypothetical protein